MTKIRRFIVNKVSIIGSGNVGATIAYTLAVAGIASEIVLIDINKGKALGEALDIQQGTPFMRNCSVYSGDYCDAVGSNIVVVTSGMARKAGQSRLELAQTNVDITKMIIPNITKYAPDATYIIVSNPVDILTYTFNKYSGIPEERIIGSGTILDTARLRARLSEYYNISQSNVHAYVFGEHGDSSFVPWSIANISNVPIADCNGNVLKPIHVDSNLDLNEVEMFMKKSGASVIQQKGATFYAVSVSVCHIIKCLLSRLDTTMTISTMMHGEYGIEDVCLSTLNLVGHDGIRSKVHVNLNDEEIAKLRHSADTLKEVIRNLNI